MSKLLIVDKEHDRRNISEHFRKLGYDVVEAGDGVEAIDLLCNRPFDLILADVRMTVQGIGDILRHMKTTGKHLPFVAMSADMPNDLAEELKQLGAGWTCEKSIEQLETAVTAAAATPKPVRWCSNQSLGLNSARHCVADEIRDLVCPYATPEDRESAQFPCQDCKPL